MEIGRVAFVEGVQVISESVYSFHERFGIGCVNILDTVETLEAMKQRLVLLTEEMGEHSRAINRGEVDNTILEAVDIAYIALGTILTLGSSGTKACYEVARKNDAKTISTHAKHVDTGKVLET